MDTTETYITMCDKAWEIQEAWIPKAWDYCYCKCKEKVVVLSGYETDSGWYGHAVDGSPFAIEIVIYGCTNTSKDNHIWLPRQDQLQEMVNANINLTIALQGFGGILGVAGDFSWEQLWLAFDMKELYNKVWSNGEDWVNAN